MTSGPRDDGICLSHPALLPREIRAMPPGHRTSGTAQSEPHWGERELIALDVFDGSIRRAETFIAYLHCNGFDIAPVSDRLTALRSLRGDLAFAFRGQHADLLVRLQDELEERFEDLCTAFRSLRQDPVRPPVSAYQTSHTAQGSAVTTTPDPAPAVMQQRGQLA